MSIVRLEHNCLDNLNLPDIPRIALKLKAKRENRDPNSILASEIETTLNTYKEAIGKLQFEIECYKAHENVNSND